MTASTSPTPTDPAGFLGWEGTDLVLLLLLPLAVAVSGTISASETVLFGLSDAQRLSIRARQSLGARAVDALLAHPASLLISILLANTTVNVLYFVLSSVLLIHSTAQAWVRGSIAVGFLVLIVLGGEIGPKILGDVLRERLAVILAPPILAWHRAITPAREVIHAWIIQPLARLIMPVSPSGTTAGRDLHSLVELTEKEGLLDEAERALLLELMALRQRRVREVMTPRVDMPAIPLTASRRDIRHAVERHHSALLPVFDGNVDHIVGIVNAKRLLLARAPIPLTDPRVMTRAVFVPEVATLEQLLEFFRLKSTRAAVVVDEYGGTAGIVHVEDIVKDVIGSPRGSTDDPIEGPQLVSLGVYRVPGDFAVHDFMALFSLDPIAGATAATVSGLIVDRLGRAPRAGDRITVHGLLLEVERVGRNRVQTALVRQVTGPATGNDRAGESGTGGPVP
ncbi:MAG: HlyC/CorC family transporter [Phycisphaeraceae bacterium]|nr:HlyC/CorC family transporter [Phycisphaeraceae bacterium]